MIAGMEACIANLVEPGDTVVVGNNGIWGARVVDMAGRFGGEELMRVRAVLADALMHAGDSCMREMKPRTAPAEMGIQWLWPWQDYTASAQHLLDVGCQT